MKIANFRLTPYLLIMLVAVIISASFYNVYVNVTIGVLAIAYSVLLYKKSCFNIALAGTVAVIIGIVITTLTIYIARPIEYTEIIVSGRVSHTIYTEENITIYLDSLVFDNKEVKGKGELIIKHDDIEYATIDTGDILTIMCNVKRTELKAFDSYSISRFRNKIYYEIEFIHVENRESGELRLDERIRYSIYNLLNRAIEDSDSVGMAFALLTSNRANIDSELRADIADAGIAHIFAVSGMHVGILAGAVYFLLKALKSSRLVNLIVTTIVLLFYAYICGFLPSINRAVLMSIMVLYGTMSGRKNDLLSILSLSAIILLLIFPLYLYDLSFLMSYGAVFGIVLLYKPMARIMSDLPKFSTPLVVSSLNTNISLFPIITAYFNTFSLYFLLANIIILPVIAFLYILLILGCIISFILPPITFLLSIGGYMLTGIKMLSGWIALLPYAVIPFKSMGIFSIFYYISILMTSDYILLKKEVSSKIMLISSIAALFGIVFALVSV